MVHYTSTNLANNQTFASSGHSGGVHVHIIYEWRRSRDQFFPSSLWLIVELVIQDRK